MVSPKELGMLKKGYKSLAMLPTILDEDRIQVFKFWFGGVLQDGTHHHNELYYRALTVEPENRPRLYHLACKISDRGGVAIVSLGGDQCSLWLSLRHQGGAYESLGKLVSGLPKPTL